MAAGGGSVCSGRCAAGGVGGERYAVVVRGWAEVWWAVECR